jgi:hypothetical protein
MMPTPPPETQAHQPERERPNADLEFIRAVMVALEKWYEAHQEDPSRIVKARMGSR